MITTETAKLYTSTEPQTTIFEINKFGIVERCYGCGEDCTGELLSKVLGTQKEVFNSFFSKVLESEKQGLESFFSQKNGINVHVRFMGRREETFLFIRTKTEWDSPSYSSSIFPELFQVLDSSGKILFTNRNWRDKIGFTKELDKGKLYFPHLLLPEFIPKYEELIENFESSLINESKVWGLKTENGDPIFVECNAERKIVNGKQAMFCKLMDITNNVSALQRVNDQSARIEAIFQSGTVLFWSVNRNKALTSFNQAYSKTIETHYGIKPEINTDLTKPKKKFASAEYHDFWNEKYDLVFETNERINFLTKTKDLKGNVFFREIYLNPISVGGLVTEVAGLALDVSDQKIGEQKFREQSNKINTIFNSSQHMIWSIDNQSRLTFFNDFYKEKIDKRFKTDISIGDHILETSSKVDSRESDFWSGKYNNVFSGQKERFELKFQSSLGKQYATEVFLSPIYSEEGAVAEVAGISQEITYKKVAEKKLKSQAAKIQAIFDSSVTLIWSIDADYHIVSYNRVFADQHKKLLRKEVSIGTNFLELLKGHINGEVHTVLTQIFEGAFQGQKQQFEGKLKSSSGADVWLETFFNPIYGEQNEIKEISCMSYDVTTKKQIEQKMQESLNEKEILLQEVHHRVKNNLQVISSILNLQTSYVQDENTLDILKESQNRIKSMSFIHESLYQTKDFSGIEFTGYLLSLANNLIHSYSLEIGKVRLRTDFEETFLSLDQAIPCGLIVNELISNSLKYAFDHKETGEVYISAKSIDRLMLLTIADNGKGLPENIDYKNSDSLGLQLVYTLADQLDAEVKVSCLEGTKYLITFEKQ